MDQFIREVDEEYRREQVARIWRRFGGLIVAAAILIVAGVGGWRYWQHRELGLTQEASTRYDRALQLDTEGKTAESEAELAALAADAPAGYRMLARFRLAAEKGKTDPEAGATAFEALGADEALSPTMRDLARLRAATLRLDSQPFDSVRSELERLASPTNPWRHTARELLGVSSLKTGDFPAAERWFDALATDRDTPAGLRERLAIYSGLAAGGPVRTQ